MSEQREKYPKPAEGGMCWVEIPTIDLDKLQKFYAAAFPNWEWQPEKGSHVRTFRTTKTSSGGGGLVKMPEGMNNTSEQAMGKGYTTYFFVDSIEESTAHLESLGAKTVLPKTEQGEDGWFSNLVDIEGNRFGIYQLRPELLQ